MTANTQVSDAIRLTVLNFKRSQASGNFIGDDGHESWSALKKILPRAEAMELVVELSRGYMDWTEGGGLPMDGAGRHVALKEALAALDGKEEQ